MINVMVTFIWPFESKPDIDLVAKYFEIESNYFDSNFGIIQMHNENNKEYICVVEVNVAESIDKNKIIQIWSDAKFEPFDMNPGVDK